jgi:hypothetical protein
MRGYDLRGQKLEARRPLVEVAHRAVGDEPARAQADVDRGLHLAPESAGTRSVFVEILDHHDGWLGTRVDVPVVVVLQGTLLGSR